MFRFRRTVVQITLGTLTAFTLATAQAPRPGPVSLVLSQQLVTVEQQEGRRVERRRPAPPTVRPGDVLTQELRVTNTGRLAQRALAPTVPVPNGTRYGGGATTAPELRTQYSADGGRTYGEAPLRRTVTVTENGRRVTREVVIPEAEYTHVRWLVPVLASGASLDLSFRVQVR